MLLERCNCYDFEKQGSINVPFRKKTVCRATLMPNRLDIFNLIFIKIKRFFITKNFFQNNFGSQLEYVFAGKGCYGQTSRNRSIE